MEPSRSSTAYLTWSRLETLGLARPLEDVGFAHARTLHVALDLLAVVAQHDRQAVDEPLERWEPSLRSPSDPQRRTAAWISSTGCAARRPVPWEICCLQDTPVAVTSVASGSARTAGNSR